MSIVNRWYRGIQVDHPIEPGHRCDQSLSKDLYQSFRKVIKLNQRDFNSLSVFSSPTNYSSLSTSQLLNLKEKIENLVSELKRVKGFSDNLGSLTPPDDCIMPDLRQSRDARRIFGLILFDNQSPYQLTSIYGLIAGISVCTFGLWWEWYQSIHNSVCDRDPMPNNIFCKHLTGAYVGLGLSTSALCLLLSHEYRRHKFESNLEEYIKRFEKLQSLVEMRQLELSRKSND